MKKEKNFNKGEVIIYKAKDGPKLDVRLNMDTVWLNLNQIADLFDTDKSGISRHIKNIYQTGELKENATVAKIATAQSEGGRKITRDIEYYNLDIIISVGYRVNSQRATQFRIWATDVLKKYLVSGYAINQKRLLQAENKFKELQETISFLQEKSKHELLSGQEQEILNLLANYSKTLTLLEQYDKEKLPLAKKGKGKFIYNYKKARSIIDELKREIIARYEVGDLFGQENGGKFKGILGAITQTFDGKALYPSLEEKAAHLLYFVIKDHPFIDGNKRIASFLFVYYLDKNNYLYKKTGEKKINDNALTALALLIAVSDPKEKEVMINIVTNLIS
ncbi:MAG: death-on-curing family protein [Parcubacteria group bacterium GW2011_GWA2_38_13]|nr:MAG: death-on-curing family protein [Parcubacteria group bacterium GW2011_GWA2_38_13]